MVFALWHWLLIAGFVPDVGVNEHFVDSILRPFQEKGFSLGLVGHWEPWLKFVTAYVQARHLDEGGALPDRPSFVRSEDNHFLRGAAYRWFETSCRTSFKEKLRLVNFVSQLKKAQPCMPDFRLREATVNFSKALFGGTRPPLEPPVRVIDGHLVYYPFGQGSLNRYTLEQLFEMLSDEVDSILDTLDLEELGPLQLEIPQTSSRGPDISGRSWPRKDGGGLGHFLMTTLRSFWTRPDAGSRVGYVPLATFSDPSDDFGGVVLEGAVMLDSLEQINEDFLASVHKVNVDGIPVIPQALPEPLKVRMITRAPPEAMDALQYVQRVLHRALQKNPSFQLTRERPSREICSLLNSVVAPSLQEGMSFVSGDYSAATDNLHPRVSSLIVHRLARRLKLTPLMARLFEQGLVGHVLGTPSYFGPDTVKLVGARPGDGSGADSSRQTWGQLMGSVVSFPVLCIANLALTLLAFRLSGRPRPAHRCHILINGDDIGFAALPEQVTAWQRVTSLFGLEPSVGKNFSQPRIG
jgi:hypothetical protein